MATCFGVHFGSTTACIAVSKDGKTEVVANEAGDRMTPAIVAFTDHDKVAGLPAKQGMHRNPSNTICAVKELIGRDADSEAVQNAMKNSTVKIVSEKGKAFYEVEYKEHTHKASPVSVAAAIFDSLKDTADGQAQQRVDSHNAVICVPVSFNEQQQRDLIQAAKKASFSVLRVIREPCAALLAYGVEEESVSQSRALVLRLGGRSTTVTIVRVTGGMFHIEKDAVFEMGGNELDELLVQHLAKDYDRDWRCQCLKNQRSAFKLRGAAEMTRQVLSSMTTAHCSVESLYDGIDLNTKLSRTRVEAIANPFVQKCLKAVEGVIESSGSQLTDIDKVVVCGGVGRSPFFIQAVKDRFPGANVLSSLPGDEVIALGAAKQAALLTQNATAISCEADTLPCLQTNVLLRMTENGKQEHRLLFAAYTPMPARRQYRMLLTPEQTDACLVLCTASEDSDSPQPVAKLVLRALPPGSQVEMVCHCRSDGSVHVSCAEPTSNTSTSVTIEADKLSS